MDLTASVLVAHAVSVPVKAVLVQENALVDQLVCVKTRQFAVLKHHQNSTTVHTTIYHYYYYYYASYYYVYFCLAALNFIHY